MDLRGKVAIVTGGARGIGKSICTAFINTGAKVVLCDVNDSEAKSFLESLSEDLKQNIRYQKCDVTSFDDYKAAFETAKSTFGKIDIIINNAGIIDEIQWRKMVNVNFIGAVHGIHLAFTYMGKNNGGSGGHVINTSSIRGLGGCELVPVYCGTKHALIGLTRSYGHQYHFDKTGIIVTAVCPGSIQTPVYEAFYESGVAVTDQEYTNKFVADLTAISPDEVAKGVLQLLQDSRNGALLLVDENGIKYIE